MDLSLLTTVVLATALTVVLTALVLRYARGRLVDVPEDRSSHLVPTPTGGGLGIVMVLVLALAVLGWKQLLSPTLLTSSGVGLLLVAGVGWADDHRDLAPAWRLVAQLLAVVLVVWALGGVEQIAVGELTVSLGIAGSVLAVIGAVWLINLYNFMDGVDGLAAIEGVFVSGVMAAMFWIEGETGMALLAGSLAGGCLGFLFCNWPPARIFLGDVGSYSIGFTLALLALYGELNRSLPLVVFGILAAVFILDATYTLISRIVRRARWYAAHHEHAYQAPIAAGADHAATDHGRVVLAISLINLFALLPAALVVWLNPALTPATAAGVAVSGWVVWFLIRRRYR